MAKGENIITRTAKSIMSLDKKVNKELYGTDEVNVNNKELDEIESVISDINTDHKKHTGKNRMEFLAQVAYNKNSNKNTGEKFDSKKQVESIEEMLGKGSLSQFLELEKDRMVRYGDYYIIDAYIPEVSKCLDVYRDSILSPDDFTKEALNFLYDSKTQNDKAKSVVESNLDKLNVKYKVSEKAKDTVRTSLLLGDYFVAVFKIQDELNKMIISEGNKDDLFLESGEEEFILTESHIDIDEDLEKFVALMEGKDNQDKADKLKKETKSSVVKAINDNIKFFKDPSDLLSDAKKSAKKTKGEIKMTGSIVKNLNPKNVIKLELDGVNFGYIYIEENNMQNANRDVASLVNSKDYFNSSYNTNGNSKGFSNKYELISNMFIKGISKKIDKKFIEDNKEFKDYIYTLVKNDYIMEKGISITYLEPNTVHHLKIDSADTYGVSKLSKSLFFAKIYLAVLITTIMQKISRGRDKRAVYVETGLDADIEGAIQQVVKDIKSKEITADSLGNLSTVLQKMGNFEDYFIPMINGEKPLDIDTVPGMDVEVDNDFMQNLLKSIVSGTNTPFNYIDVSADVDFARSLAMQNNTFVRSVISHQKEVSDFYTSLFKALYENEYPDETVDSTTTSNDKKEAKTISVDTDKIKVVLQAPVYLNISTLNDQISNASTTVDYVVSNYYSDSDDEAKKNEFKRQVTRDLLPHMNWDKYDAIYDTVTKNENREAIQKQLTPNSEGEDSSDGEMSF